MADERKPSVLHDMTPLDVISVARGTPGYKHLQGEAEEEVRRNPRHYDASKWQKVPRYENEDQLNYAKGGPVGKIGQFGMKRSKPDFAGGGSKTNFKMDTKKGKMPW